VSISSLARDLDVDVDTTRALAEEYDPSLILLSENNRDIITKSERDVVEEEFEAGVLSGIISKMTFAHEHNLSQSSLEKLVNLSETQVVEVDGYLYSTTYNTNASSTIAAVLRDHLEKLQ
jgi:hypothetical protein